MSSAWRAKLLGPARRPASRAATTYLPDPAAGACTRAPPLGVLHASMMPLHRAKLSDRSSFRKYGAR
jgi:hypothetical protein